VEKVSGERTKKKILTLEEAYRLLPRQWETVWPTYYAYVASKLAAYTGMRIGEVMGLRGEFVHDTYIEVNGQWHKKYGFAKTKNGKERNIPITRMIREELEGLIKRNGTGYLFSENGGEEPMSQGTITYQFKKALEKIGINESERRARKLTFHGWRHFLNTTLRMANVTDSKIREVTGHSSEQMTDWYTHFDPREFTEVVEAQEKMLKAPEEQET
jgi:integrase